MASLTNSPESINTLDKCISWTITPGAVAQSPSRTVVIARLICKDTGEKLTPIKAWTPKGSGDTWDFDIVETMRCVLYTAPPDCNNANTIQDIDGASKKVCIEYGEFTIEEENCEEDAEPIDPENEFSATSEEITVLNSYCQPWEQPINQNSNVAILSARPERYTLCRCSKDWIYVWTDAFSINPTVLVTGIDGSLTVPISLGTSSSGVTAIPAGPEQISDISGVPQEDIASYEIRVGGFKQYNVYLKNCCCEDGCRMDVFFLEPKGGYSVMVFDCVEAIDVNRTGTEICRSPNCGASEKDMVQKFGRKYLNKRTWCSVTGSVDVKITARKKEFYKAFASAGAYYIAPIGDTQGNLIGFIPDTTTIPVYRKEGKTTIRFSGHYSTDIANHLIN